MANSQNYQQLNDQLDELLTKLQQPEVDVDEALKLYEQGQLLIKKMEHYLTTAENKLKRIQLQDVPKQS